MFNYLTSSIITASLWGVIIIIDVIMGKISPLLAICIANMSYGFSGLLIFIFFYDKIKKDFNKLFKSNKLLLFTFIFSIFFLGTCARFFYYSAYKQAGNKAHIAFSIMFSMPIVLSGLGAYLFLKEELNVASFFGMFLIIVGIIVMKFYGPKEYNFNKK
jgi:uncharacterized membrane protein